MAEIPCLQHNHIGPTYAVSEYRVVTVLWLWKQNSDFIELWGFCLLWDVLNDEPGWKSLDVLFVCSGFGHTANDFSECFVFQCQEEVADREYPGNAFPITLLPKKNNFHNRHWN